MNFGWIGKGDISFYSRFIFNAYYHSANQFNVSSYWFLQESAMKLTAILLVLCCVTVFAENGKSLLQYRRSSQTNRVTYKHIDMNDKHFTSSYILMQLKRQMMLALLWKKFLKIMKKMTVNWTRSRRMKMILVSF